MPKQKVSTPLAEPDLDAALATDLDHYYSRKEFCAKERISPSSYNNLRIRGHGPVEEHIPFTKIFRISERSRLEWKQRMRRLAQDEAAKAADGRRREQARIAGRLSAQSPRHVSKVNAERKRRRVAAKAKTSP
jgi:hypothetical protein